VAAHRRRPLRSWSTGAKILSGITGVVLVGAGVFAATNWVVGLSSGSSSAAQSASISNLTISAVASPSATNLLHPGGTGDVAATITNPNSFPTLTTPLTVAANGTLTVTFTNDASMTLAAPAACANTFFSMPSLTGATATGGAAKATTSPATDGWTS
jgi:hypothetical protein